MLLNKKQKQYSKPCFRWKAYARTFTPEMMLIFYAKQSKFDNYWTIFKFV